MIHLQCITWDHTRGLLPLVATAQRYHELHPEIEITWRKRSLQAFADFPVEKLAEEFDMLIIDHPFVGYAAAHPVLLPLDEHLPAAFLADQAKNSVGLSHISYDCGGHQWALAVDAATPVSAYRPDLIAQPPATWDELIALAKRGLVALPAIPIDALMAFYMLCCGLGEEPFATGDRVVSERMGIEALERYRYLAGLCSPDCLRRNPIMTYEAMTQTNALAYCPFAYGYSNYARPGYARHPLRFGGLVTMPNGARLRSTLGGTGLAISRSCKQLDVALDYAMFVASPACQRGLYVTSGGQPSHRSAWADEKVNHDCGGFFADTLATLDQAYLRPRYNGYMRFQDEGGLLVHTYLRDGGQARDVLRALGALYQETRHTS